ncbi:holo-ACP synthase [bacterium]|nr:holo-ACP synthase [bacterium]
MDFDKLAIGTDIEEIERFSNKTLEQDEKFLRKIYTPAELEYCFKDKQSASHLCARYCAKEAVVKALSQFEISDVFYGDIEILNHENNSPYCIIKKYPNIEIKVSLSHSKTYATATVLCFYGIN